MRSAPLQAHGVYHVDLKETVGAVEWIIEVEVDTGKIMTPLLALSSEAAMWLESCQFTLPGSSSVQQERRAH